jgi:hypothetical protein
LEKNFKENKESLWDYCTDLLQRSDILSELKPSVLKQELLSFANTFRYHMELQRSYSCQVESKQLPFVIQLFKPDSGQANEQEWKTLLKNTYFEIVQLKGDHHSTLEKPNVLAVCTKIVENM